MYDVIPDLMIFYYVSMGVIAVICLIIGFGIRDLLGRKLDKAPRTQGAAYDAMEEPQTQPMQAFHDERARRLLKDL